MNYKDFEFWNKEKLWKLRKEICLGSLYLHHYENSFDIPAEICCNFFDGFVEWCWIIEEEKENGLKSGVNKDSSVFCSKSDVTSLFLD